VEPIPTWPLISGEWKEKISNIIWVAYSPPTSDPNKGIEATPDAISKELIVLRTAGFTGLVTYSSSGVLGREFPKLAKIHGFQGLIMGIWDPSNQDEIAAAKVLAELPIVVGFCVGNEDFTSATIKHCYPKRFRAFEKRLVSL
jgi:hypothetical protein